MTSQRSELSSRDYEREAQASRHRLADSLDELSDRLTPGQVFDEMLTYARGGSGTFFRALTNAARENPVPSLLIGAGCMMFLSEKMGLNRLVARGTEHAGWQAADTMSGTASGIAGSMRGAADVATAGMGSAARSVGAGVRSAGDFASEQASNVASGVRHGAESLGNTVSRGAETVGSTVSSASQAVRDTATGMRERVGSAAGSLRESAAEVGSSVRDYSQAIGEQVSDTVQQTRRQAGRATRQLKDRTTSLINEQPLLFAALGLAVGAAIAAALPSTETEDEWMGEASDAVKDAVTDAAAQQFESAKAAAGKVVEDAKTAAEREGLTPSAAADVARNLGEKVKRVATETGAAASSEARDFAKGVGQS